MTLADTSFLIDLMRGLAAARERRAALEAAGGPIGVPAIVVYELERGAEASRTPPAERARIRQVLSARPVLPLDEAAARAAGTIEGALRRQGVAIDPEDALIAGTALSRAEPLVTRNVRHFGRVPGLTLETY
jgi:tRNA(fMet)-specific endonuclease VapC